MLDTSTLHCYRVSCRRSAVVENREQIFKVASIGHGAPPQLLPECCSAASGPNTVFRKSVFCAKWLWFADATNRIQDFGAGIVHSQKTCRLNLPGRKIVTN